MVQQPGDRHFDLFVHAAPLDPVSDGDGNVFPFCGGKTDPCFPFFPAGIWRHRKTGSRIYPDHIRIMYQRTLSQQTVNDSGDHDADDAGDRKFDLQPKCQAVSVLCFSVRYHSRR